MTRLKVNPTRSVLADLKARLDTSKRGHKLLKDKQDELMRRFIKIASENRELRKEVEEDLEKVFQDFSMASAVMSPEVLESALLSSNQVLSVSVETENVMGVRIPSFSFEKSGLREGVEENPYPYGFFNTYPELDQALKGLDELLEKLIKLTKIEKASQLMAEEIEHTRRRVNALEYRTIPDLEETIRYIEMKLEEEDRSTISRLLKIKDLINDTSGEEVYNIDRMLQTNK